jgi:nicotinamide riboside transporter PnuC
MGRNARARKSAMIMWRRRNLTWALTILSLIGVVLNIHKRKECFYIWAVTNFGWAVYDFAIGAMAQGALFAVYFCLAIWGIVKWKG